MAELAYQTWQRLTGKSWSEAKKSGFTDGSSASNTALQKKLLGGWNPYGGGGGGAAAGGGAPADPLQAYRDTVAQWYSMKPATPATFAYSGEQEAFDTRSVQEQYKPFYQEQATFSGRDFTKSLQNARAGFSQRGLWGASAGVVTETDPTTGLVYTKSGAASDTGGPVSGTRQVGEQRLNEANTQSNTAFGRAYTQAVAQGVQGRRSEAEDIYQKTVRQPYEDQYKTWLAQLSGLQRG